jgi:acyl-CoA synthetase (AMP-forming)/AMP-acid ligase II
MSEAYPAARVFNVPQHLCVHRLLEAHAERASDAMAILAPGRAPLTYGRLRVHIDDVVQRLRAMGLGRNDRVALVLSNGPEAAVAFLAVAAAMTCAPFNPAYSANEFDFYFAELRIKALLVQAGMDSPARDVARARGLWIIELSPMVGAEAGLFVLTGQEHPGAAPHGCAQPDDIGLVVHTSGTTTRPKVVSLTQTNLCTAAYNIRAALALVERDRCLNVMPLFHGHGLLGAMLASLAAGASVVCTPGFAVPEFFPWMAEFHPTWYTAVPTIHQAILAHTALHREIIARCPLRFIRSGSAPLPPQVLTALEEVFHAPVIEYYGMTEASMIACNLLPPCVRKPASVGVAVGTEIAVIDEAGTTLPAGETGEVVVRGATVIQGYENDPMANRNAFMHGWFRTGDAGYLDANGYLFVTGRIKELINRGGEKIAPQEVDHVLMDYPAVAEAATFPVPHAQLGEEVAAAVVLHPTAPASERDLRRFAATRLAVFKVPRWVLIVEQIPKGPTGKLQRMGLAERLGLTAPDQAQPIMQTGFTAPGTPLEEMLAGLWAQVFELERVGIHDDFFHLGETPFEPLSSFLAYAKLHTLY